MPGKQASHDRLVGDIGGTNTRLGLFNAETGVLGHVRHYHNADFAGLAEIIDHWIAALTVPSPKMACLAVAAPAVAAPPFSDEVTLLNIDWAFSIRALKAQFNFERLRCINDFEGNAYALPHLHAEHYKSLRGTIEHGAGQTFATIGPGTGLGGATLFCGSAGPVVRASEPGHMGLAPATPLEFELFQRLYPQGGEVFAEQLISGPGLVTLYRTIALVNAVQAPLASPGEIVTAGQNKTDSMAKETLDVFCALLGSICGDYVLATGSYSGLYIAGGIAPRILDTLCSSQFMSRFSAKGAMQQQLEAVPVSAVTTNIQGLIGAAHTPL